MPQPTEARLPDAYRAALGRAVAGLRRDRGWRPADLAARSGLSQSLLHHLERGTKGCSLAVLYTLADALGLRPSQLLAAAEGEIPAKSRKTV